MFNRKELHNLVTSKIMLLNLGFLPACAAASAETENELDEDGKADDEDDEDEADHVQQVVLHPRELEGGGSQMFSSSMTHCMLDPPNSCVLRRQRSIHKQPVLFLDTLLHVRINKSLSDALQHRV